MNLAPHSAIMQQLSAQFSGIDETITTDTDLQNELGLDSLGIATFVAELTGDFNINLEHFAEHIGEIRTVSDLIKVFSDSLTAVS